MDAYVCLKNTKIIIILHIHIVHTLAASSFTHTLVITSCLGINSYYIIFLHGFDVNQNYSGTQKINFEGQMQLDNLSLIVLLIAIIL